MYLGIITADALRDALDKIDSPHVDLGPLLHLDAPLRVGVSDLHDLLQGGEPSFDIAFHKTTITVHREDGGLMATLELKF